MKKCQHKQKTTYNHNQLDEYWVCIDCGLVKETRTETLGFAALTHKVFKANVLEAYIEKARQQKLTKLILVDMFTGEQLLEIRI